jgi:hypothetical protein
MLQQTYRLPSHFASALINDDWSGLNERDARDLKNWLKRVQPGHATAPDGEPFFAHGHAMNKNEGADCLDFIFLQQPFELYHVWIIPASSPEPNLPWLLMVDPVDKSKEGTFIRISDEQKKRLNDIGVENIGGA